LKGKRFEKSYELMLRKEKIFFIFFLLDQKETKNQEQTIAPHQQHGIAFVQALRASPNRHFA
jgi:hypothetical protein